ncbi:MAG: hypothetical protein H5T50_09735, partial [Nitrososphaeria archaeon]|nr:hypothetical protein [Nitrososphaeria archaeon]
MRGILSYRAKEGQKLEFYRDHIKNCNIIWFSKYRERVTGTISRRIARTFGKDVNDIEKNVEKALDVIITYHDLGKLTKIYQD